MEYDTTYGFGLQSKNNSGISGWKEGAFKTGVPTLLIPEILSITYIGNEQIEAKIRTGKNTEKLEVEAKLSLNEAWESMNENLCKSKWEEYTNYKVPILPGKPEITKIKYLYNDINHAKVYVKTGKNTDKLLFEAKLSSILTGATPFWKP